MEGARCVKLPQKGGSKTKVPKLGGEPGLLELGRGSPTATGRNGHGP